ncbi:AzlC family ABC transporter permease [Paenibacillus albicereus]|uniref:AzlC family ABC transporter permease n=1 Tax=Paenibacillus albicereus TaxID=2726185 RepID=A0A6H2GTL8_9BACL|nr:AzlC family ABC transporter permease [Paenibacillus albicereus]QJC50735.1 AzlC family ABC transporter permease [Paenibacillus albicereus]
MPSIYESASASTGAGTNASDSFLQGVRDCLPTLLGYLGIGFAFGIVAVGSGLSVLEAGLLAVFVYAGAAQFVMVGLLAAGAPLSAVILTTFIVNLRHLLMSLAIAPHLTRYPLLRTLGFGALLTDETFGVATVRLGATGRLSGAWMDGLNVTAYLCWIAACVLGAAGGRWIEHPEALGLDFALPAMFAALLVLQLQQAPRGKLRHRLLLLGCVAAVMAACLPVMPSHLAVLVSTVLAAALGAATDR